jgi:hypothetical protein
MQHCKSCAKSMLFGRSPSVSLKIQLASHSEEFARHESSFVVVHRTLKPSRVLPYLHFTLCLEPNVRHILPASTHLTKRRATSISVSTSVMLEADLVRPRTIRCYILARSQLGRIKAISLPWIKHLLLKYGRGSGPPAITIRHCSRVCNTRVCIEASADRILLLLEIYGVHQI